MPQFVRSAGDDARRRAAAEPLVGKKVTRSTAAGRVNPVEHIEAPARSSIAPASQRPAAKAVSV
jgi:hypothetical protein